MKKVILLLFVTLFLCSIPYKSESQDEDISTGKLYRNALKLLQSGDNEEALIQFLALDSVEEGKSFATKYQIGVCYLKSKYDKTKAIPYLEMSVGKVPFLANHEVYNMLGILYHEDYKFDEAIRNFEAYLRLADSGTGNYEMAERMIEICNNAKKYVTDTTKVKIENFGPPVNTLNSEYSALVSTDQKVIYYTSRNNPDADKTINPADTLERIFVSRNEDEVWAKPTEVIINSEEYKNVSLAGISPDGEQIFLNIDGDLFSCKYINGNVTDLKSFGEPVNSKFHEGNLSMTADGSEIFFSSNRKNGFGGSDIYKSNVDLDGKWSEPVNLGAEINTKYDEDAPFIHPDKKTFYFSSKGHESIGGYDIFQSYFDNESWRQPTNIGYPINTVKDDLFFILSANGGSGHFSSDIGNRFNCHDIYKVELRKSINLTMVRGKITAGDPAKPVNASIKVIDKETGERIRYIYNPNPKTGKYLMIFPPGKNYEMIVEAEGFLPHLINIYVPDQEYFYELYQEIHLNSVTALGESVGEKITVTSTFQDVYKPETESDLNTPKKDYTKLRNMVDNILAKTDSIIEAGNQEANINWAVDTSASAKFSGEKKDFSELFSLVDVMIESIDTTSGEELVEDKTHKDKASQTYYYAEDNSKNNLEMIIVGNDTIYTTPALEVSKEDPTDTYSFSTNNIVSETADTTDFEKVKENYKKVILSYDVCFSEGESNVEDKYINDLEELADLAKGNSLLGFDIISRGDLKAESDGDTIEYNKIVDDRFKSISKVFKEKLIDENRIVLLDEDGYASELNKQLCSQVRLYQVSDKPITEWLMFDIINFDKDELKVEDITEGQEIRLNNIFFDLSSAKLTTSSSKELLHVVKFLNDNPKLIIEIGGHTDNTGSGHMELSTARAQSVVDFLTEKGVENHRLIVKGYGDSKPVADNNTEEGRLQNRRVVFMVLEK